MELQPVCFNEFPDQCITCPEYEESRPNPHIELTLLTGMIPYQMLYRRSVTKECKIYHKHITEYY